MAAKRVPVVCHGHSRPIVEVNYSFNTSEGYFLASASKDGKPMLRHGENGDWYGTFEGHKGAVWSCVLNQPALQCATGSADFTAKIWDACAGNMLHEFQHGHIVRCVNFSRDTKKLVTGGHEKMIRIFDLAAPNAEPQKLPVATSAIRTLNYIQNDTLILCSYSDEKGLGVYDARTLELVKKLETEAPVTSVEVTFDQGFICTAEGHAVRVFDARTFAQLKSQKFKYPVESASYCPAKQRMVAGQDCWVHLYDWDSGAELEVNKGHHGPVHTVRWSPLYEAYASGSEDGTIRIWPSEAAAANSSGEAARDSALAVPKVAAPPPS